MTHFCLGTKWLFLTANNVLLQLLDFLIVRVMLKKLDTGACFLVTKQHAGIDTHLDILIRLGFVFAGQ